MNSLFLILCTLVIYFFGYRYFSKFLRNKVFQISTPRAEAPAHAISIAQRLQNAGSARHELLGFHFATITGLTTISGAAVALFWGWVPAYLWLLVGSSVAAGTFAMGSLWLRRRNLEGDLDNGAGTGLIPILGSSLHKRLAPAVLILILLVLIATITLFVYLSAVLLISFPSATWPLITVLILVALLSRVTANQSATIASRLPSYLIAVGLVLLSIWISHGNTLGFSGSLNLDLSGRSLFSVDSVIIWGVVVLLLSTFVQRQPFDGWQKSFAVLGSILTLLMLFVFYVGIAIDHPPMSAKAFTSPSSPGLIPWLFITFTSGAYAGFHFLIAYSVTGPKVSSDSDITYVGYGAALLEGLFALTVILVFGSTLGSKEVWAAVYQSWSGLPDGATLLGHYVNGLVNTASRIGVGNDYAETYSALVLISLALISSIALLRVMRVYLQELGVRFQVDRLRTVKTSSWTGFGILLFSMFLLSSVDSIKSMEQLFGPTQYLLASIGLLVIAQEMAARKLPKILIRVFFGVTAALGIIGYIALLASWYRHFELFYFSVSAVLLLLQLSLVVQMAVTLWRERAPQPSLIPPTDPEV